MSSLPLARLGPRPFAPDRRFALAQCRAPETIGGDGSDPLQDAYERGFAEGEQQARAEFEAREQERSAQCARLDTAIHQISEEDSRDLAEKLRQSVLVLCEQAVLPLALEPAGLAARIERACAMLARAQDEKHVRVNPEDFDLVRALVHPGTSLEADPSVERGGLRIETADGGIEDGPSSWRAILEEALGEC